MREHPLEAYLSEIAKNLSPHHPDYWTRLEHQAAVAPDLLEALKEAEKALVSAAIWLHGYGDPRSRRVGKVATDTRAAIAKAKGGEG